MGTPGHMAHPFDVDKIKTGQDLIDYINDAVLRLQNQEIAGSLNGMVLIPALNWLLLKMVTKNFEWIGELVRLDR